MEIQAVFFDMGGTLETYSFTPELRLSRTPGLQKILNSAGIDLALSNEELYRVVRDGLISYHRWSLNSKEELPSAHVWSNYILHNYSVDSQRLADAAEDLMCFIETRFYQREMRPEIPEILQSIREMGLKIGLISNVNSLGQVPKNLAEYQIGQFFDPIVLSSEFGWRKPDPSIFHQAARLANVPTSTCVHVGDRIARDVLGAKKAGFKLAVQILHDFDHGEEDTGASPDFVINSMTELLPILETQLSCTDDRAVVNSPIRAVIFDAGDVLYFRSTQRTAFTDFLEKNQIKYDVEKIRKGKALLKERAYRGQIAQDQYFEELLGLYGINEPDLLSQGKHLIRQERGEVEFFEGVQKTLFELKQRGYLLGIITDTANSVQAKLSWFERGGFAHVWDSIISSKDIGVRKPNPKIYHAILDQLGLAADQTIFVGHKPSELDGAHAVGMHTAAFNYDQSAQADYYLENFSDILSVPLLVTP
jgi:putative hydrolase of the HAD superfamily